MIFIIIYLDTFLLIFYIRLINYFLFYIINYVCILKNHFLMKFNYSYYFINNFYFIIDLNFIYHSLISNIIN